ncbi:hypothetical protein P3X46_025463 [Hevea brasiliensis]|uniref:Serine aminopeptidase S33 domain-containing protein n=1 Tax=Hevea brasiliensis TaxID=3981 RepID=A0ABQ9L953_HEVBR|nr:hypothetical protein P3X46_025463 [Hevea brasiliensis]
MEKDTGNIRYDEEFILNSRGLKLFTCRWIPVNQEPVALIFICHGYAMECSISMNSTAHRLAKEGFAIYGIDYEGHGKSAGLQGYVDNMDNIIDDCTSHFTSICEKEENRGKMRYLLGESMGGAVALLLHRKKPEFWDGAVLVAPMCKIAEDLKPHPVIRSNAYCYKGRPRLKTGYELLRTTMQIEQKLQEVSLPFLVLHGKDDRVTDKSVSKQLHNAASSTDKTIKLYPGMWHGLLYGEPLENIEIVFKDIIDWLGERAGLGNTRLERETKQRNDDLSKSA